MAYEVSITAHMLSGSHARTATVYDLKTGDIVARGVARLAKTGEPTSVNIPGFVVGHDWGKLDTGQGPGEWVCSAYKEKELD